MEGLRERMWQWMVMVQKWYSIFKLRSPIGSGNKNLWRKYKEIDADQIPAHLNYFNSYNQKVFSD